MASALVSSRRSAALPSAAVMALRRAFAAASVGCDIVSAAPGVALQKSRSWDEGVSSKFSITPLKDIFQVFSSLTPLSLGLVYFSLCLLFI